MNKRTVMRLAKVVLKGDPIQLGIRAGNTPVTVASVVHKELVKQWKNNRSTLPQHIHVLVPQKGETHLHSFGFSGNRMTSHHSAPVKETGSVNITNVTPQMIKNMKRRVNALRARRSNEIGKIGAIALTAEKAERQRRRNVSRPRMG